MKKYFFVGLFILLLFPCFVDAKEYCKVFSGDGNSIGTELACGTEHFYIVENDNNTVKMLAKYNLLVGDKIYYFEVGDDYTNQDDVDYCYEKTHDKIDNEYNVYHVYAEFGKEVNSYGFLPVIGCRIYEKLNPEHIRQDERAIGPKLDSNGKTIFPLYGITYMNPSWGYDSFVNGIQHDYNYDENGDLIVTGTEHEAYLNGYKTELLNQNIEVSDVSYITLSKTVDLLKAVSGKEVVVNIEHEEYDLSDDPKIIHIGKMDIINFVPDNQKWILNTTYWLGSGYIDPNSVFFNHYNDYFIADVGLLCTMGRGNCTAFEYPVGNGVRPLVTISADNIGYLIRTKTDGHGTVEVVDHSPGGQSIKFRVNSNTGYKLDSVTIKTDSGEIISFKEGEIQKNSDGTMSIDKNNFTMPFENVTIEARWRLDIVNPNTGAGLLLFLAIIILSTFTMTVIIRKRERV